MGVLAAEGAVGVVEDQLDGGLADRFARIGAVEDNVRHRVATQVLGRAFAHDPAYRIDGVGLAAAVGTDNTGQIGGQRDGRRVNKGLETGEFDLAQSHIVIRLSL